ncbi:lysoplasmalogenase-like protein TMEM86A [Mya arenaria]|uniref:lysoplasmalogenase-like protein TMEM86A n=1 Tax=Mya arenaria TaxID=6604 RepID=UPI0022DFA7E0|nr:lysoplasmalogenase-like protein TMEM86A [Mya arenaria]XP_052770188.1 lysoplasmalogenase-like protein TMEM86A [Mya arenaria]
MIPKNLMPDLTRDQKLRLIPFAATWLAYYILYMPISGHPTESLGAAFFKLLPIASLAFYVVSASMDFKGLPTKDSLVPEDDRQRNFLFGLAASAVGDICLVWRHTMFIPGLLAFAVGHMFYLHGLKDMGKISRTKEVFVLLGLDVYLFLQPLFNSYVMSVLVGLYCVLIFTMAWRAMAWHETDGSKASLMGCLGALLFIMSDFLIAIDKWFITLPFRGSMIMSTYFGAQLLLSLSTTHNLK